MHWIKELISSLGKSFLSRRPFTSGIPGMERKGPSSGHAFLAEGMLVSFSVRVGEKEAKKS